MPRGVKRWLKRIAVTVAAVLAAVLVVAAVVAWRATRVPAWYAAAVENTPPDADADRVLNGRITPLQNWLARTSAGDLDAKPDSEKVYALELTEDEVNAVLAKLLDNVHGACETYRVRLTPGRIDMAFRWAEQGRTITVTSDIGRTTADAAGRPTVALGGVRMGEQAVPRSLFAGPAAQQVRARLDTMRKRESPPRIDANDAAPPHTVERYYARLLLACLAGRAVAPEAFLPKQLTSNEWVATRVIRLDVAAGRLKVTFRMMTPEERDAVVDELAGPLPGF